MQRPQADIERGAAADLELAVAGNKTADGDNQRIEEVQPAVELEFENIVDDADAATELDIKRQQLDGAVQRHVKQRVAGDHIAGERGVVVVAGIDLQECIGLDAEHRNTELDAGLHPQRKEGIPTGVDAKRPGQRKFDFAEVAEFERDIACRLQAVAVDQQVDAPFKHDRPDRDRRRARDAQHLRRQRHQDRLALGVEDVAVGVTPAYLLGFRRGVDLQQKAPGDVEDTAAVDDLALGPRAADLQAAVDAAGDDAQRSGHRQRLEHRQVQRGSDAELEAALRDDDAEVALQHDQA